MRNFLIAIAIGLIGVVGWQQWRQYCSKTRCDLKVDSTELVASRSAPAQSNHNERAATQSYATLPQPWPPRVGESYPDLELLDQRGEPLRLSSLRGKVLIVEPVGMTCPSCNAFAGAGQHGPFPGAKNAGHASFRELLREYGGGMSLDDDDIVFVQILFYDMSMKAPNLGDARAWAEHFHMQREKNQIVLVGTKELQNRATYDLIPGFQLIDKDFVLRIDATGHHPRHNLVNDFFPMLRAVLAKEVKANTATNPSDADVRAAYQAIPHRQTTYRASQSKLDQPSASALQELFKLVDAAIIERVSAGQRYQNDPHSLTDYENKMQLLIQRINELSLPDKAHAARDLIVEALRDHMQFFDERSTSPWPAQLKSDARIADSHRKLVQAYNDFRANFPESEHNTQAFFDHLCALDFI